MAKAWIEHNAVRDVCPVGLDPVFLYGEEIGANYSTEVPDGTAHGWILLGGEWQSPPPPPPAPPAPPVSPAIPQSITRAQAKLALLGAGLLDNVQPAIDAITDPTQRAAAQIEWDDRLTFERTNPTLIALATAMGMSSEQLDALFAAGAQL